MYANIYTTIIYDILNREITHLHAHQWMNGEAYYIHIIEYYLVVKNNGILIHVTK